MSVEQTLTALAEKINADPHANFIKLVDPTAAFVTGKLKIKGDLSHSIKLQTILNAYQS